MAMGRPQKPHTCSWTGSDGKQVVVPGLYHCPDGRWRINATGKKFTEKDERRAVQKFLDWQRRNNPEATIHVDGPFDPNATLAPVEPIATANGTELPEGIVWTLATQGVPETMQEPELKAGYKIPEAIVWPWLRELFIKDAPYIAKMTGLPELAGYRNFAPPAPSLKLDLLIEKYENQNPSGKTTKHRCVQIFRDMMKITEAMTLEQLTTDSLTKYRSSIETSKTIQSAETKKWMYGQIKSLIAFGLKVGLDSTQITAALARCMVLWTDQDEEPVAPHPISREDFHTLLKLAADGPWRAWLLVALNCCLKMGEACGLKVKHFNLEEGTYAAIRKKTKKKRVPRAATLWPETIAAITPFIGKSEYLFTSPSGTKFSVNSRCNLFKEFREKTKNIEPDLTFDWLRDGAFTAAMNGQKDERLAKVLGGHACGMSDRYVLRNPACVKDACDAVYATYGPF